MTVEPLRKTQHLDIKFTEARKSLLYLPPSPFTAFYIGKAQPVVRNVAYHVTPLLFRFSKYNFRSDSIYGPKDTKTHQKTRLSHLTEKEF
jgi:hypothetical protein